jgi:hypothetical protein
MLTRLFGVILFCELPNFVGAFLMLIRAGYNLIFAAYAPTPMISMVSVRPDRWNDLQAPCSTHEVAQVPFEQSHAVSLAA